eukprot:12506398-Alexandrium_andersonii.AAC.1
MLPRTLSDPGWAGLSSTCATNALCHPPAPAMHPRRDCHPSAPREITLRSWGGCTTAAAARPLRSGTR